MEMPRQGISLVRTEFFRIPQPRIQKNRQQKEKSDEKNVVLKGRSLIPGYVLKTSPII